MKHIIIVKKLINKIKFLIIKIKLFGNRKRINKNKFNNKLILHIAIMVKIKY